MVSLNLIALVVLKILHKLVSMQKPLFANICWRKQNHKKCPIWPKLYFHWNSRKRQQFCVNISSGRQKKNVYFRKSIFFRKRNYLYMRNCVEIIRAVNVNVDILTFWHVWLCNTFNMKTRLSRVYFLIWSGREVFATILEMEFANKVQKKKKKKKFKIVRKLQWPFLMSLSQ